MTENNGWLPIESAPQTGEFVIIGWSDNDGLWQQRMACWDAYYEDLSPDGPRALYRGAWTDYAGEYQPTHWRPLPTAPLKETTK